MQKKAVQSEITSFCTKSLVFPLHYAVYIIQSPWQLPARNTNIIQVNTNTNIFMVINHYITYYHVLCVLGPPNLCFSRRSYLHTLPVYCILNISYKWQGFAVSGMLLYIINYKLCTINMTRDKVATESWHYARMLITVSTCEQSPT